MYNVKSRVRIIDGQEFVLAPLISWREKRREFRVQDWKHGQGSLDFAYSVHRYGSVQGALDAATIKAISVRQEQAKRPPYRPLGVDKEGKPIALGHGIYMQINTDRDNYQLIKVIHGTAGRGNRRTKTLGLGRMGHFTRKHFNCILKRAQVLRDKWAREDASNEHVYKDDKKASA